MNASPDNILVRIKNKLMLKLNIDSYKLKYLISSFVSAAFKGVTGSKMHYTVINLTNELTSAQMTIKVFFKFLNIIRAKKIILTVTVITRDDKEVSVSEEILIGGLLALEEEDASNKASTEK